MPQFPKPEIPSLQRFNCQVIAQALALVDEHDQAGRPPYAGLVGSHIRHVIEHYEALLLPALPGIVDYDRRPRDRALERSGRLARIRLLALRERLTDAADLDLDATVSIHGQAGLAGELGFVVTSTIGRELVFVASHAVHHFALLHAHCLQHGIPTGENFGKAPATVAHQRNHELTDVNPSQPTLRKEFTCPTLLRAA